MDKAEKVTDARLSSIRCDRCDRVQPLIKTKDSPEMDLKAFFAFVSLNGLGILCYECAPDA
jgi:hypothetical protein